MSTHSTIFPRMHGSSDNLNKNTLKEHGIRDGMLGMSTWSVCYLDNIFFETFFYFILHVHTFICFTNHIISRICSFLIIFSYMSLNNNLSLFSVFYIYFWCKFSNNLDLTKPIYIFSF